MMINPEELTQLAFNYIKKYWREDDWMFNLTQVNWGKLGQKKAGCYDDKTKSIAINTMIITPTMTREIEETLLHELIHLWQYNHPDESIVIQPPHGKAFRLEMYRINGILGREAVKIYHNYQMPGNEKVLRKAKALLARMQSNNEHEATIAAAKFTQYLQQYDLQLSDESLLLAQELPELEEQVIGISKVADSWRKILLSGLAYVNACQLFWQRKVGYIQWKMIGREHRLAQVVLLYDYLEEALEKLVKLKQKELKKKGIKQDKSYWNAFRVGIAYNINERLRADFESRLNKGIEASKEVNCISALTVQNWFNSENLAVTEFLNQQNYKFRTTRGIAISNSAGYNDGNSAGNNINTNQQINQTKTSKIKFLRDC
jgi:predicted SprT family Zn-dependent metalloprotease